MLNVATATREELETAACCEPGLYEMFDEQRLLNEGYTVEELREIIGQWIEAGDECAAS
jgi:hypothetical protein